MIAIVGRLVEREGSLAGVDADLSLLGNELPGENIGYGGVELDLDAVGGRNGDEALGDVGVGVGVGTVSANGLATPACCCADLKLCEL